MRKLLVLQISLLYTVDGIDVDVVVLLRKVTMMTYVMDSRMQLMMFCEEVMLLMLQ